MEKWKLSLQNLKLWTGLKAYSMIFNASRDWNSYNVGLSYNCYQMQLSLIYMLSLWMIVLCTLSNNKHMLQLVKVDEGEHTTEKQRKHSKKFLKNSLIAITGCLVSHSIYSLLVIYDTQNGFYFLPHVYSTILSIRFHIFKTWKYLNE
jgi:hypothetical protein